MVNISLIEAILHEQDNPGYSTTRQIRDLYNTRSGEEPITQHSDEDKEFQTILMKALETFPIHDDDDEDTPISYTVKLKDSDDSSTPTMKRRSIIKLPKETKEQSESDESSSDSEKISTASSITITKPFSPLFLNNMKKFGVSTDWLAKRSNSLRQAAYSRSSVESNTSKLDAMIKSASAKPIRSNRKLSFVEPTTPTKIETDKENTDPSVDTNEKEEEEEITKPSSASEELSSEIDEDKEKDIDSSPTSKEFSLRIPRVNLPDEESKRLNSSSSSSNDESKQEKPKLKRKRKSKSEKQITDDTKKDDQAQIPNDTKKIDKAQARIEHLKKLLRISGIRLIFKKTELDQFSSKKAKIDYLKSLFDTAGFTGSLSIKDCEKFRKRRDEEKELLEIQATAVDVKGHVKGGRTLRGEGRNTDEFELTNKRKRTASSEIEDNNSSDDDDEKSIVKKRRILKMEASPEVSDDE